MPNATILPSKVYLLRFDHHDSFQIDEQEYTDPDTAWKVFRLFAEPDSAEIYTCVALWELNYDTMENQLLATLNFPRS